MADLIIEHLTKRYGPVAAVDDVSLKVESGHLLSLLGPSGCGKTTTLNSIAGLEQPDSGLIRVGGFVMTDMSKGLVLPPERRHLGMVFQSYALWPHMTVFDNLAFGLKLRKIPRAEMRRRISDTLELVSLGGMEKRYPYQLSGGQQQRVALARAVVGEPEVLLLDEPLSNLDAKVREQARFWLREMQQRLGITAVYVTHDQAEALAISDMVAVMSAGKVLQHAPPHEIYERPATRFVADFIGSASFLKGTVAGRENGRLRVTLDGGIDVLALADQRWQPGQRVALAIRSERVRVTSDTDDSGNIVPAKTTGFVYLGSHYQYVVETPAGTLKLESPEELGSGPLSLNLPAEALLVLPEDSAA